MKCLICFSLLFLHSLVADSEVRVPLLGYVYDSGAGAVRAIEGVPGASLLGSALALDSAPIASAAAAADQNYLLAITSSGEALLLTPGNGAISAQPIPGATSPIDVFSLSPSGSSAALYNSSADLIQIVTGLPGSPTVAREIGNVGAPVDRLAVSDDGKLLLIALQGASPVLLAASDGQPLPISVLAPVSAIVFRAGAHDAVLVDTSGRITAVSHLDTSPDYQLVQDASASTVAAGYSRDGRRVFTANADGTIAAYDLSSGDSSNISCSCVPTGLYPMQGDSVFRLNEPSDPPLLLFDGPRNRVVFVVGSDQ
jgi:hypothetical protein